MFLILMFVVITLNMSWENEKVVEISCLNILSGKIVNRIEVNGVYLLTTN